MFCFCLSMLFIYSAAEEDSDDMFKPPKMDDDDFSPFGGKGGLFSGGRGLFDDDDEVCEQFSELFLLHSSSASHKVLYYVVSLRVIFSLRRPNRLCQMRETFRMRA